VEVGASVPGGGAGLWGWRALSVARDRQVTQGGREPGSP